MDDNSPWKDISQIDSSLHAPARIAILLFLMPRSQAKFAEIQKTLGVTPGNLSSHLKKLEKSHFIDIEKRFCHGLPTTIVYLTNDGYNSIINYTKILNNAISRNFV